MKISVCMITYNHTEYIEEAIDSIISQKGINQDEFELVIGEDFSTDSTREKCLFYSDKYPGLIKLIPRKENIGMLMNFKETLKACNGKYIALCEGDDFWTNSYKLHKQLKILDKNPNYAFCFHKGDVFQNGNILETTDYKKREYYFKDFSEYGCFIKTMSVVFRKSDLDFSFFEKKEYKELSGADMLLYLGLTLKGKSAYCLNETMGVYRHHAGGVWNSLSNDERLTKIEKDTFLYHKILPLSNNQRNYLNLQLKKVYCARFVTQNKLEPIIIRKLVNGFVNRIAFIFGVNFISRTIMKVLYKISK